MKERPGSCEYPVFNAGPRECLGKQFAMIELKTCLAMLLPQVSFQLAVPTDEITPDVQLTIGMARGLPCFVRKARGERTSSTMSTTIQSESDTVLSEAERTVGDESEADSQFGATSESAHESACSERSTRRRGKKRLSGWTRQRRSKFWHRVRA